MNSTNLIKLIPLLSVLSLLSACSQNKASDQEALAGNIIGGVESTASFQKENGVVALLTFSDEDGNATKPEELDVSICTGNLVARRVILTARHCVAPGTKGILATFGTNINAQNVGMIPVVDLEANSEVDMVLLVLEADAPAEFKLTKLPGANSPHVGSKLTLAGYGVTDPIVNQIGLDPITGEVAITPMPGERSSGVLHQVSNIEVLAMSEGRKEFAVSGATAGACHGDSGGPAYLVQPNGNHLLVGITSRTTSPIGNCDAPTIYGTVATQAAWITAGLEKIAAKQATAQP